MSKKNFSLGYEDMRYMLQDEVTHWNDPYNAELDWNKFNRSPDYRKGVDLALDEFRFSTEQPSDKIEK